MPEVSIITPCYNSSEFLPETIHSVLSQTFHDWEWIITDDCSTDHSVAILERISDHRVIILKTDKNGGAGKARNIGLKKASGRFITFLDADDFWMPEFLEEMTTFMKSQTLALAYCSYMRCGGDMQPVLKDFVADTVVTFQNTLKTCRLSLLSSMYDSSAAGKEYFPEGSRREDHVMWLNLLKKIPAGTPYPKTLAKYRMHSSSISRNKKNIVKDQYLVYRDYMQYTTLKSLYFTAQWAVNGFRKYSKIFN